MVETRVKIVWPEEYRTGGVMLGLVKSWYWVNDLKSGLNRCLGWMK
jgi:hypothetical protein